MDEDKYKKDKKFKLYKKETGISYPNATAAAIERPSAADLPRPLAAVKATVVLNVFSDIASINFNTAFA